MHVFEQEPSQTLDEHAVSTLKGLQSESSQDSGCEPALLTAASHRVTLNRENRSVCCVMSFERDRRLVGALDSPARLQVCLFIQIHISSHPSQSVLIRTTWGILRHPCPPDTQSQQ